MYTSGNTKFWVGGLLQNNSTGAAALTKVPPPGVAPAASGSEAPRSPLTASGYYGEGLGTTLHVPERHRRSWQR